MLPPCQLSGSMVMSRPRTGRLRAWVAPRHDHTQKTGVTMAQPTYQVTNPANGEVLETFPFATDADVENGVAAAAGAFKAWSSRPMEERVALARKVATLFAERSDELAKIAATEMGKSTAEGAAE